MIYDIWSMRPSKERLNEKILELQKHLSLFNLHKEIKCTSYSGAIDTFDGHELSGWCKREGSDKPLNLSFFINGERVAKNITANNSRIGKGEFGFLLHLDQDYFDNGIALVCGVDEDTAELAIYRIFMDEDRKLFHSFCSLIQSHLNIGDYNGIYDRINNLSKNIKNYITTQANNYSKNKINLMLVGATGAGKSSTINAIFGQYIAQVGYTPNPETDTSTYFSINGLNIWDTPGLGDSKVEDKKYKEEISNILAKDVNGGIDCMICVIDSSSRDLGTSYDILLNIIKPYLKTKSVCIALNKIDVAMGVKEWNDKQNIPSDKLLNFMYEKEKSIKKRIKESVGYDFNSVFYSSGFYDEETHIQAQPYNILNLLHIIYNSLPEQKRYSFLTQIIFLLLSNRIHQ